MGHRRHPPSFGRGGGARLPRRGGRGHGGPAVARHKLEAGGLIPPIELGFGGFGDSAASRAAVAQTALDRLSADGWKPDPAEVWIVGDTPRDLACARAVGVRCALVATGRATVGELAALGADIVLPDLSDPRPLLELWRL